jgi:hypothetical protein
MSGQSIDAEKISYSKAVRASRTRFRQAHSALYADNLPQRMEDFDKIALGSHDRVDILVGARRLVNYPFVFAAFDARSGSFMIGESEGFLRGPAAHLSAGTMGTAMEALGIALPAHNETASTH